MMTLWVFAWAYAFLAWDRIQDAMAAQDARARRSGGYIGDVTILPSVPVYLDGRWVGDVVASERTPIPSIGTTKTIALIAWSAFWLGILWAVAAGRLP